MIKPVSIDNGGYRKFGWIDPTTKKIHNGHDYNVPVGTSVKSICDGEVVFNGEINGFGSFNPNTKGGVIILKHQIRDKIFYSLYGHISRIETLKLGRQVKEGDIIGYVNKYTSSGVPCSHLHFCIWYDKSYPPVPYGYVNKLVFWVNPLEFLK